MIAPSTSDVPAVKMLPPTLVLIHIAAGITLNWLLPIKTPHAWGFLGLLLLGAAFGMTQWAKNVFNAAGTNIPPNKPATAIVSDGPYKFTRNPMYLSMVIGLIGLSLMAGLPIMLLTTAPLFYILDRHIIQPEETYLTQKFGENYSSYKSRVRRWL